MGKASTKKSAVTQAFEGTPFDAWRFAFPHATHLLTAQAQYFEGATAYMERCIDRQTAIARTSMEAVQKIADAKGDGAASLSILQNWQAQSIEHANESVRDWMAFWKDCADRWVNEEIALETENLSKKKNPLPTRIPV